MYEYHIFPVLFSEKTLLVFETLNAVIHYENILYGLNNLSNSLKIHQSTHLVLLNFNKLSSLEYKKIAFNLYPS